MEQLHCGVARSRVPAVYCRPPEKLGTYLPAYPYLVSTSAETWDAGGLRAHRVVSPMAGVCLLRCGRLLLRWRDGGSLATSAGGRQRVAAATSGSVDSGPRVCAKVRDGWRACWVTGGRMATDAQSEAEVFRGRASRTARAAS